MSPSLEECGVGSYSVVLSVIGSTLTKDRNNVKDVGPSSTLLEIL